jgi:MFS family permease
MNTVSKKHLLSGGFGILLLGTIFSSLGDTLIIIAIPFIAIEQGKEAGALSILALASSLPRFFAPALGVFVDKYRTQNIFVISAIVRSLLCASVAYILLANISLSLLPIYIFAIINAFLSVFISTTTAIVPNLVQTSLLPLANGLITAAIMGVPLLGYALAGYFTKTIGATKTMLIASPLFALLILIAFIKNYNDKASNNNSTNFFRSFFEGFEVFRSKSVLWAMLFMSFSLNVVLNIINVRSPLIMNIVGDGAGDYAIFEVFISSGALLGIIFMITLLRRFNPKRLLLQEILPKILRA